MYGAVPIDRENSRIWDIVANVSGRLVLFPEGIGQKGTMPATKYGILFVRPRCLKALPYTSNFFLV